MNNHQRPDPISQAKEFWGTVVLHRWGILLASVVLAAVSVVVITLLPDTYVASTTVLFDPQKLSERYVEPTVTADPSQRVNTLTKEVLSAGRLQQISQEMHLNNLGDVSQQAIVDQMRKNITIEMKQASEHDMSAFEITYTGQDAQLVAAVANRLAQSFIDWDLANREQRAASTTEFMAAQVRDAKQAFDDQEAQLQEYKLKHSGELPEQLESNEQALSQLHANLRANREALDRLEQEKTLLTLSPESAHSAGPVISSERDRLETERRALQVELTSLRAQYTEQYPDVLSTKHRLAAVTQQLSQMGPGTSSDETSSAVVRLGIIQRETERLQEEQVKLNQQISQYQAKVDATPLRGQEFEYLNRNYANARDRYEGLLDQKFHAEMAMDLEHQQKASRFQVDPAQVPENPIKPNRLLLLAITIPFCAFIPTGAAVAAAEIKGTVNDERTLRSLLPNATRVVGNIPIIETPSTARKRRRMAAFSILSSFLCCAAVAVFLWGGGAAHRRKNHSHQFSPTNPSPSASLLPQ